MSDRLKSRCRAYLVTYHALPGPAVGGLRLSALAEYLVSEGLDVSLFSARETSDGSARRLDSRIRRYQIPDRKLWRKATLRSVRIAKRMLGLRKIESVQAETEASSTEQLGQSPEISWPAKIRFHVFRVAHAVDDKKWWSVKLLLRLAFAGLWRRPAIIIASGPPYSPVAAASVFSKVFSIPAIVDLRDPWLGWTDLVDYAGLRTEIDRAVERYCLKSAAAVTTTAPSLATTLRHRYPARAGAIGTILNGFDPEMIVDERPPVGALQLLYAGTIYQNRSPMPLLQGIARVVNSQSVDASKIKLVMAGNCLSWRHVHLPDWVRSAGIEPCVKFIGSVSRDEVRRLIASSNVLINLAQGQRQQIPAKLFEHVASRRVVLLFAESDSDSAVVSRELSAFRRLDDSVEAVAEALWALYGQFVGTTNQGAPERVDIVDTFSRHEAGVQFHQLVAGIVQESPRSGYR
jgi:glycosyltransferase involved in cell wall biosynthesis